MLYIKYYETGEFLAKLKLLLFMKTSLNIILITVDELTGIMFIHVNKQQEFLDTMVSSEIDEVSLTVWVFFSPALFPHSTSHLSSVQLAEYFVELDSHLTGSYP